MKLSSRYILLFQMIVGVAFGVRSQDGNQQIIDSLRAAIQYEEIDTVRGKALYQLGKMTYTQAPDSALTFVKEAYEIVSKYPNKVQGRAMCLNIIGVIYKNKADYSTALEYYQQAIKLYEEIDNEQALAPVYNDMGVLYKTLGQYNKALEYYKLSRATCITLGHVPGIIMTSNNIGTIYSALEELDSAGFYYELALSVATEHNNARGLGISQNNLGELYTKLGEWSKALEAFLVTLKFDRVSRDDIGKTHTYINLGNVYSELGDPQKSLIYFDSAEAMANSLDAAQLLQYTWTQKAVYFEEHGNFVEALRYERMSHRLNDSLRNDDAMARFQELEVRFEMEKKEREIADLAKEKAMAEVKISNQRGWIIGIILAVLMLAALGAFIFVQRRRKTEAEMAAKELEYRKQLLDATVLAEENERQRIAKDLHDGLVQSLAVLKLGVQSAMNKVGLTDIQKPEFAQHIQQIDAAADEARNISHQMMPRVLMESGLIVALDDMLHKTLGNTNISYDFEQFHLGETRFETRIEVSVYRICQEMVNNIIKHSAAKSVSIQLFKTKTHLVLHIEDDGLGFDLSDRQRQSGIGLSNIFSRASAVNGEVNFEKGQPKGTVANVRIPIG